MRIRHAALAVVLGVGLAGCTSKSELEAAEAKVAEARRTIDTLQRENQELRAAMTQLSRKHDEDQAQIAALLGTGDAGTVPGEKPRLPLVYQFRRGDTDGMMRISFTATIRQPLPLQVTVKGAAPGGERRAQLVLGAGAPSELGPAQGITLQSGDQVELSSQAFAPMSFQVP